MAGRRTRLLAVALSVLLGTSCTNEPEVTRPVSEPEARAALDDLVDLASKHTAAAMDELCELSLDDCGGMSGAVRFDQSTVPRGSRPEVLCSRDVGEGSWMLVIDGEDGLGRPYTSQVVFDRDGERVVPLREPAFWLGVGYTTDKVVGSTSWSTAYGASGLTAPEHTAKILGRARAACEPTAGSPAAS